MKGSPGVGPFEWLGKNSIEVIDEGSEFFFELIERAKTRPLEESTDKNAKPTFYLVEP